MDIVVGDSNVPRSFHGSQSLAAIDFKISQCLAAHVLVLCLAKYVSTTIRLGHDGRGLQQAKLFWQGACVANCALVFVLRLFTPAAASASWDLRYPLMAVAYETFMLGLYGFF